MTSSFLEKSSRDFLFVFQEDQVSVELAIDPRVHSRLIGTKGRAIHKFMDSYKVDIRFPRSNSSDPVIISGTADNVEEAREQLLLLEEEYVSSVVVAVVVLDPCVDIGLSVTPLFLFISEDVIR